MSPFARTPISRRRVLGGLAVAPAAGLLAARRAPARATGGAQDGPVRFGVSAPLSGDSAQYGEIWQNAMAIAVNEINAAGGIKGRPLELRFEDTQANPQQSVPVAQRFVSDETILAELGDFASPASMAASPVYERGGMVQFGFTNSHPDFTKGGEFMFSTTLSQVQDAAFLAKTAVERLGRKQAVLYRNTDWGNVTQGLYVDAVRELGGEVVAVENYLESERDFRPILSKIADAQPEVVSLISYYTDGALIAQQTEQVGLTAKIVANGACNSPQFIELGGAATEEILTTTVFFPGNPRPEAQPFVDAYRQRVGQDPDSFGALAYDGVKILAWAADRGNLEREGIRQALADSTDIPSIIYGPFAFAADRRVENASMVPIRVRNGAFAAVE